MKLELNKDLVIGRLTLPTKLTAPKLIFSVICHFLLGKGHFCIFVFSSKSRLFLEFCTILIASLMDGWMDHSTDIHTVVPMLSDLLLQDQLVIFYHLPSPPTSIFGKRYYDMRPIATASWSYSTGTTVWHNKA